MRSQSHLLAAAEVKDLVLSGNLISSLRFVQNTPVVFIENTTMLVLFSFSHRETAGFSLQWTAVCAFKERTRRNGAFAFLYSFYFITEFERSSVAYLNASKTA